MSVDAPCSLKMLWTPSALPPSCPASLVGAGARPAGARGDDLTGGERLARVRCSSTERIRRSGKLHMASALFASARRRRSWPGWGRKWAAAFSSSLAAAPRSSLRVTRHPVSARFPGGPPIPLAGREAGFVRGFPSTSGAFPTARTDSRALVVEPTRKLHQRRLLAGSARNHIRGLERARTPVERLPRGQNGETLLVRDLSRARRRSVERRRF